MVVHEEIAPLNVNRYRIGSRITGTTVSDVQSAIHLNAVRTHISNEYARDRVLVMYAMNLLMPERVKIPLVSGDYFPIVLISYIYLICFAFLAT